jgi:RNA polymerase sigma factor (sigma-70 family)
MTGKDLIKGIKEDSGKVWRHLFSSPAEAVRRKVEPMMKDVRDVTFDDVFEEACIILMENVKAGKLDEGETNLEGYLFIVCKRIALKHATKKKAVSLDDGEITLKDERSEVYMGTPDEEAADSDEVTAFLDRVLEAMPANQRTILQHFYWDKMSMSEIAALCGLKNENVAKTTKNRCMDKFRKLAKQMLEDDEMAEAAIAKTIERAALRNQIDECKHLESGALIASACKDGKTMLSEKEIIEGIRNNSPVAWKALYATIFNNLKKEISPILE